LNYAEAHPVLRKYEKPLPAIFNLQFSIFISQYSMVNGIRFFKVLVKFMNTGFNYGMEIKKYFLVFLHYSSISEAAKPIT